MNRTFKNPKEFSEFVKNRMKLSRRDENKNIKLALTEASIFLTQKAKEKFGHYQTGWSELSETTKKDRVAKGFSENEPLLRTGDLRDSVRFTVGKNFATVGSTSEIMLYQEKGTSRTGWSSKGIPPRPVFLITQLENGEEAVQIFFKTFIQLMRGEL
jgi:phage gpG-like protein